MSAHLEIWSAAVGAREEPGVGSGRRRHDCTVVLSHHGFPADVVCPLHWLRWDGLELEFFVLVLVEQVLRPTAIPRQFLQPRLYEQEQQDEIGNKPLAGRCRFSFCRGRPPLAKAL